MLKLIKRICKVVLILIAGFIFLPSFVKAQEDSANSTYLLKPEAKVPISIPLGLIGIGGIGAIHHVFLDGYTTPVHSIVGNTSFSRRMDDVFSLLPIPSVYVFDALGLKANHDFANRTLVFLKAEAMMLTTVHLAKNLSGVLRPDSSDKFSFPSGHTAQAFLAAGFWHHEMGNHGIGYSIAGYAMAGFVASLRVMHNKHWVSDVIAGAGVGILSTEIAYRMHHFKKRNWRRLSLAPEFTIKSKGIYIAYRF